MLTIYGTQMSRAFRVLWLVKEMAIPYRHVATEFLDGSCGRPDFLTINPNGRIPAIEDDGLLMFESMAITLYLARKYAGALSADGLVEECLATQWSLWATTEAEKPLLFAAFNRLLFAESERSEEEASLALSRVLRPLGVLEKHLADRPFVLGDRFTVADLNVSSVLALIPIIGMELTEFPRVQKWLQTCLERPAAAGWDALDFCIPRPKNHLGMLAMLM